MANSIVQKETISAQVASIIRSKILSGEYKAGSQLRQERVASEMGVSRIPVREALHQLHSEGFVTLVSHKGAVVTEIAVGEILELYELRARVETWLLALAIPHMTDKDFAVAEDAAARFGSNDGQGGYSHDLNWQFHTALYAPSKRTASIEVISKVHQKIERYTTLMTSFAVDQEKSSREHEQLLQYCRARDILHAINLLDMHIMEGGRLLVEKLNELRRGD